jgi:nickel/cobalt transporter (NiCoT) family protein
VAGLHVLGFVALLVFVAPSHDHLAKAGIPTIGIGVTAYTLGLRHAFDSDHISAIDNTTRKLMAEGKRPLSVGFWFSLGHSTIVFALALLISIGVRSLGGPRRTITRRSARPPAGSAPRCRGGFSTSSPRSTS